jgi:hypothetical protein
MSQLWEAAVLIPVDDRPEDDLPPPAPDAAYTVYTRSRQPVAVARREATPVRPVLVAPAAAGDADGKALAVAMAAFSHFAALHDAPAVALVDAAGTALPRVIAGERLASMVGVFLGEAPVTEGGETLLSRLEAYVPPPGRAGMIPATVYVCPLEPLEETVWWVPAQVGQPVPECPVHHRELVPRRLGDD